MSSFSCPFREPEEKTDLSDTIAHITEKVCLRKFEKMSRRIMNTTLIDSKIYIQYLYQINEQEYDQWYVLFNSKMMNCILQLLH